MPNRYLKVDLAFSDSMYSPEDLLSDWMAVYGLILTTSLLFYHMSRVNSLKVNPYLAKFVSISLIVISTFYLTYALIPYTQRMDFVEDECKRLKECHQSQIDNIRFVKNSYLSFGIAAIAIQILIVYIVVTTI